MKISRISNFLFILSLLISCSYQETVQENSMTSTLVQTEENLEAKTEAHLEENLEEETEAQTEENLEAETEENTEAAMIDTESETGSFKPLGAYKDTGNRALRYGPMKYGFDAPKCQAACTKYKYFALQNNGWCCCDNDLGHATKYGRSRCGKKGGPWCNYIYQNLGIASAPTAPTVSFKPLGAYKDTANRALRYGPKRYGFDANKCLNACKKYRYFALQNNGWCSCDNDLGHATKYGRSRCGKKGGPWCNYIYQNLGIASAPKPSVGYKIPSGWWNIVGPTGLCVSARHNNGRLVQENCGNRSDLLWSAQRQGNGLIILNRTGRAMDNAARRGNNGNPILGYRRNNTPAQIWAIESVHNGNHLHFRNIQRNKCLDDTGRHAVGAKYHLWSCSNGNRNQWFRLAAPRNNNVGSTMKIPSGRWFNLVGPGGLCIEASNKNGHRLVQRTCNHENDLQWQFIPSNGGYIVRNRNAHVIDNSGARNRNGNPIIGYRQHGKPNQIWAAQAVNGNTFLLRNPQTNRCMDATGRHANGRLYHLWSCSKGNRNQWFRLGNPQRRPVVRPTPRPMPRPMPRPIAIPDVIPAPITPAPMPQWGASYPIAFFKPTPGNIDMETLRN